MKKIIPFLVAFLTLACMTSTAIQSAPGTATPSATTQATQTAAIHPTTTPRTCGTVTAEHSVHVRYTGNEHAKVVGWLLHAETVSILDNGGQWWKIHAPGIDTQGRKAHLTGYVQSAYLKATACP